MFLHEIVIIRFIFKHINNKQEQTNGTDRIHIRYADLIYSKAIGKQLVFRLKNKNLIDPKF